MYVFIFSSSEVNRSGTAIKNNNTGIARATKSKAKKTKTGACVYGPRNLRENEDILKIQFVFLALVKDLKSEGRKEMFYVKMHSTHFIYGYMASNIWYRAIQKAR